MQLRQFQFEREGGPPLAIQVHCREPPETQAGKTLTWQVDSAADRGASDGKTAPAPAAAGTAAAALSSAATAAHEPDLIGLDLWPASIALCRYLVAHRELVAGQKVLELGAGMGLVGLACAALGASRVLLTDYEPAVLTHVENNAALNSLQQGCACQQLDWRHAREQLATDQRASWRLVVAADVLYASAVVQPLIDTLLLALHPEGVALVGHQVRRAIVLDRATRLPRLEDNDEPLDRFQAACTSQGLVVRVLSSRETCSNVDSDPMVLLAVVRQQEGEQDAEAAARLARLPTPPLGGGKAPAVG